MADPEDVRDPESSGDPAADDSTSELAELRQQILGVSRTVADVIDDVERLTRTVEQHSADLGFIGRSDGDGELDDGLPYECIGRLPPGTLFVIDSAQFEVIGISPIGGQLKVMTPGGDRHYMNPTIAPDSVEWTPEVEGWDHLHDAGDDGEPVVAESQPAV